MEPGKPSLLAMAFGDEPLGPWDHRFTFGEDLGCAFPFLGFVVFVVVAALAGIGQIVKSHFSAADTGKDVLHGEGVRGKPILTAAVFATASCALLNLPPQLGGDSLVSHRAVS